MSGQVRKDEVRLKRSSLMEGKSGTAACVPIPMCGQEPSVGDAKPTFQRGCMERICRPCPQEMGAIGRLRRPLVIIRTSSVKGTNTKQI